MLCIRKQCTNFEGLDTRKMISSAILSNKATIWYEKLIRKQTTKNYMYMPKKVHPTYHCRMHFMLLSILPFTIARPLHTTSISYSNAATSPCAISLVFSFSTHPSYTLIVNLLWTYSCMFINMNCPLASNPQWLVDNPLVLMSMFHRPFMYFYTKSSNTMNVCHILHILQMHATIVIKTSSSSCSSHVCCKSFSISTSLYMGDSKVHPNSSATYLKLHHTIIFLDKMSQKLHLCCYI